MSIKIKYKVSDILHDAADNELAHNHRTYWFCNSATRTANLERFSCCAIENAVTKLLDKKYSYISWSVKDEIRDNIVDDIKRGLEAMGLDTDSTTAFEDEFSKINSKIQGQRYFWLKWAALMAKEQGV